MVELFIGLATGILGALLGLGGGFILVPFLSMAGYPIHTAVGTSSASIVFTALSASVAYWRHGTVRFKEGTLLASTSVIGAYIGAWLTDFISSRELKVAFGAAMVYAGTRMFIKRNFRTGSAPTFWVPIGGFGAGILSGLLGIGGGIINVPLLHATGLSIHESVATSSFSIIFTASSGALKHAILGNVDFHALLFLVPGLVVGAQIGAWLARKMESKRLKIVFSLVVIALALRMIAGGLAE